MNLFGKILSVIRKGKKLNEPEIEINFSGLVRWILRKKKTGMKLPPKFCIMIAVFLFSCEKEELGELFCGRVVGVREEQVLIRVNDSLLVMHVSQEPLKLNDSVCVRVRF